MARCGRWAECFTHEAPWNGLRMTVVRRHPARRRGTICGGLAPSARLLRPGSAGGREKMLWALSEVGAQSLLGSKLTYL